MKRRASFDHALAGVSIWRYGAENSAKRKFTAPRALFAAPEIKKYSALARAGLVRTCSRHAARVHVRHCSTYDERARASLIRERTPTGRLGLHNSMRMRAAPRTIVAPHFQPQKTIFSTPLASVVTRRAAKRRDSRKCLPRNMGESADSNPSI